MGRPTKKQKFIDELLEQIETDPKYIEFRSALYKEYIVHLIEGGPRPLYNHFIETVSFSYDYYKDVMKDPDPRATLIGHITIISSDIMEEAIKTVNQITVL